MNILLLNWTCSTSSSSSRPSQRKNDFDNLCHFVLLSFPFPIPALINQKCINRQKSISNTSKWFTGFTALTNNALTVVTKGYRYLTWIPLARHVEEAREEREPDQDSILQPTRDLFGLPVW